ncbi:hypothetical protein QFC19_007774 [Naganishia cerealis]|uniref:Uncharacterized protein n=1 Tax=Naganishia cerealis TaxID=610337 RepID=A0ACC2V7I4_9TREE|nr:hypothetical protein QFC19_007774 [Naganishia cerealis]
MATKIQTQSSTPRKSSQRGRSYLIPQDLPARPTDDDLNALEQYLSRVSGSTETLHQGLAKAYLPVVLQNAFDESKRHQVESNLDGTPAPFPTGKDGAKAQRRTSSTHLPAFPGFENYAPARKGAGGIPAASIGDEQRKHSNHTWNFLPLGLRFPFRSGQDIPPPLDTPTGRNSRKAHSSAPPPPPVLSLDPSPLPNSPIVKGRQAPDIDKASLAPSQSLSQVAARQQQSAKTASASLNRRENRTPNKITPVFAQSEGRDQDTASKKEMSLLDWARSISGPHRDTTSHPSQRPLQAPHTAESVAMSLGSRMGGTNVDDGQISESSSTTTNENDLHHDLLDREPPVVEVDNAFGQYFSGEPPASSHHPTYGGGNPLWNAPHHHQQQSGYDPHYLHPASYPFPPQQPHEQQAPGLTPSASASQAGWQSPAITDRLPRDDEVSLMETLTVGGTTLGGLTTAGGVPFSSMGRMRSALELEVEAERRQEEQHGSSPISSTLLSKRSSISQTVWLLLARHSALSKPQPVVSNTCRLQSEIRTLQARIIAEHVSRSTLEKNVADNAEQAREYRSELASAVRALRRAKEETKKLDEERKKGMRLYEETRERLVKYHEALKVQEARDAGREEGRLEAFHEIERWMTAPPIPIEPLGNIPPTMLHPADQPRNARRTASETPQDYRWIQDDRNIPLQQGRRPSPNGQYTPGTHPGDMSRPQAQAIENPQFERNNSDQDPRQGQHRAGSQRPYEHSSGILRGSQQKAFSRPSPGQNPGFVPLRQTPPVHPDALTPHNAADAYLDRVQYEPRLQRMLADAPARSFPMTSTNVGPTVSHTPSGQQSQTRRPSSTINPLDKPLPIPHNTQHRRYVSTGSQIFPRQPAESILDHAVPVLSPDDQYSRIPAGYVDPRHVPLPETASDFGTIIQPMRHTTGPCFVSRTGTTPRSRLAVGLRNEDDLSMIDERDEAFVDQARMPMDARDLNPEPEAQAPPDRGNLRAARSMQSLPSWRVKPRPVMPKRLAGAGTDIQDMHPLNSDQMRAPYEREDIVHGANRTPHDAGNYRPIKAQSMHIPSDRFLMPRAEDRSPAPNFPTRQKAHTVGIIPRNS